MELIMKLYNDKVMDHFMNPRNVGDFENPDGTGIYSFRIPGTYGEFVEGRYSPGLDRKRHV